MLEDTYEYRSQPAFHWTLVACLFLLGLPAMLFSSCAYADETAPKATYVAEFGDNKLYIFQEACPLGGWFETWGKARWLYRGKFYEACWKPQRGADGEVKVHTVDAAGDAGDVPVQAFRKQESI